MLDLLKSLCAASGVSGDEGAVRDIIRNITEPFAESVRTDAMGNLIVEKRGKSRAAKKIMVCAHMDEVGVVVTDITDDGYVKFACAGGIDRRVLIGKRVYFGAAKTPGVVGCKAVHLTSGAEREAVPKVDDLYIDIGAGTREDAEKLLQIGDTGAFDATAIEFGNGYLAAKAIDDRLGCAVMLELLKSELPQDVTFVFTVQEEVGARGAQAASFSVAPEIALVLEATTAADLPGVSEGKTVCKVGGGAVIPFMDGGAMYDRALWDRLTKAAAEREIPWQTKRYISGGTDAQAVQRSRAGVATLAIAAPVRNLHSPLCVGKISDFDAVLATARLFLEITQ
ncbi:MAG: M42 family metallopeptidase [Oscillospiraceae bacterium]|jgi:endoglucanase|nr:M42 family metallopeptidase [Oscillospiraceae bacterium]